MYTATQAHDNGHYDKAIDAYKKVLEFSPDDDSVQYNLGVAYISNKQVGKARAQMQKLRDMGNDQYADILKQLIDTGAEHAQDRSKTQP